MPAADNFSSHSQGLSFPIRKITSVTPADGADLASVTRAVYVGGAGNLAVVTANGDSVTLTGLSAGIWHPLRVARILSTGTTATSILAGE